VEAALNSMTDLANRASVVIYAIDPAGLTTNSIAQTSSGRTSVQSSGHVASAQAESQGLDPRSAPAQGAYPDAEKVVRLSRQDSLREIAHNTGGLAVTDNNDLNASLDRILEDHSGYYLLAYEPDASTFKGRATFHKLKVEVKRRGLGVRSRKGFYSVPDEVVAMSAPPME
jgi:VWFA-related protein